MKVAVVGMGHLGLVTAACLASRGHQVMAVGKRVFQESAEPQLPELLKAHAERLWWLRDFATADLHDAEVVWYCEDTPVDAQDRGDADGLMIRVSEALHSVRKDRLVILSSQVPVGTTEAIASTTGHKRLVYIPENLKKGQGVSRFLEADRWVVGLPTLDDWPIRSQLNELLKDMGRVLFMPLRAAEMTKHAINSYLAACITLTNEIGRLCQNLHINPEDVEDGLRSDKRVGSNPPVKAGGPITGGTLLRDVWYLQALALKHGFDVPVLQGISDSNVAMLKIGGLR